MPIKLVKGMYGKFIMKLLSKMILCVHVYVEGVIFKIKTLQGCML